MAFDAFLKIDGITGEAMGGAIRLESFSWGVSNSASGSTGSGAGAGKPSFQDFSFTTQVGKQSPQLFKAAADGSHIASATLTVGDKYEPLTIRFGEVFISNYKLDEGSVLSQRGENCGLPAVQLGAPVESISFNFLKIEYSAGGIQTTG
jgi:type VI secretion system secreted protein Hcp